MGVGVREGEWWGGVVVYIDVYLMIVCVEGGGGEWVRYIQGDKATI